MPFFRYLSVTTGGKKVRGVLEAATLDEATSRLQSGGVILLSLNLYRKAASQTRLKAPHVVEFVSQLASLLQTGMPLYESLSELAEAHLEERYYPTLAGLCEQIKQGASLAEAMRCYPQSFSELMVATIDAGQIAGRLSDTLLKMSTLLQQQQKRGKQLLTASLYPLILLGFSSLLIVVLLLYVIPSLELLFEDRTVNPLTRIVIATSHTLRSGFPYLVSLLALCAWGAYRFCRSKRGKVQCQGWLLRLPLMGILWIKKELSQFAHLMQVMLEGGVPLLKALAIARSSLKLEVLKKAFESAEQKVVEGRLLSQELKTSSVVPPLFSRLLAIGEEGGGSPDMFGKIAELYEGEVDKSLNRLTALAQPVLLLVMGVIVGVIMLAVLLPLTDVNAFI